MLVCSPTTSVRLFLPGPTPLPFSAVPANSVCSNRRPGPAPSNTFEGNGASGSLFGHAIYKIITFSLGLRDLAWPWLGKCGVCARVTRLRDGHLIPGRARVSHVNHLLKFNDKLNDFMEYKIPSWAKIQTNRLMRQLCHYEMFLPAARIRFFEQARNTKPDSERFANCSGGDGKTLQTGDLRLREIGRHQLKF